MLGRIQVADSQLVSFLVSCKQEVVQTASLAQEQLNVDQGSNALAHDAWRITSFKTPRFKSPRLVHP